MIKHSKNIYMSEFYTHNVTVIGFSVTYVSRKVVIGTVAVWSQTEERSWSIVTVCLTDWFIQMQQTYIHIG